MTEVGALVLAVMAIPAGLFIARAGVGYAVAGPGELRSALGWMVVFAGMVTALFSGFLLGPPLIFFMNA